MRTDLATFLDRHREVVRVRIVRVRGSSPREAGAEMFVAFDAMHGTIGGGQLEYLALDEARKILVAGQGTARLDISLGPAIGQCCGGRVEIVLDRMDGIVRQAAIATEVRRQADLPVVHIFGAGHVGRALAGFFERLPVRAILIDSRAQELRLCTARVELRRTALAEAEIRTASPGSAFIVLTHDHALDFLLTAEALERGDAAYVGMIGSATKRRRFERFARDLPEPVSSEALICPIGANGSADKRPEVIAAFVAAEVTGTLTGAASAHREPRRETTTN